LTRLPDLLVSGSYHATLTTTNTAFSGSVAESFAGETESWGSSKQRYRHSRESSHKIRRQGEKAIHNGDLHFRREGHACLEWPERLA
jgi:hypothetical protein